MKQQGHHYEINVVAYSPNGSVIASGGDDGKVKIWDTRTSFCFVTFKEHTGTVTGLCFLPTTGNAVLSSSLDGTVRAFDLIRYKQFYPITLIGTSEP
jgi:periodic tryptophan protein 2